MKSVTTAPRLTAVLLSAAAIAAMCAAATFSPRRAAALPQYTAETKLPCGACHVRPAGGGALTPRGQEFHNNGHKLSR